MIKGRGTVDGLGDGVDSICGRGGGDDVVRLSHNALDDN